MTDAQSQHIIGIAGAGRMGRGIAVSFALAGQQVYLIDFKTRSADEARKLQNDAMNEIAASLKMLATIGMIDPAEPDTIMQLISFIDRDDCAQALANSTVVFEAVPETLAAKETAFGLISEHTTEETIIASTTSTILSDDLQPFVSSPQRFLNAHWLNPAFLVPLVELSPCGATLPQTTAKLKALLESMGKVPVVCSASPGYIVPRMQMLAMNEAARMVEEGVASVEDIDKASKYGFGFRFAILGMLEFIDWGGGDILYHAGNYMTKATGESRFASPDIIKSNMQNDRVGLRTGEGFLEYDNIDTESYKQQKLAEFVAMLKHLDVMPARKLRK